MKKLKLQAEDLAVDSFPTGDADDQAGTVQARELTPTYPYPGCPIDTRLTDCPCTPAY